MNAAFRELVEPLEGLLQQLLSSPRYRRSTLPRQMPIGGVYLFSEAGCPLYVGRSQARLRDRIRDHGSPHKSHNNASFAARLVLEVAAHKDPNNMERLPNGSLLMFSEQEHLAETRSAKARIAEMDVQFIEERDSVRRTLLEIYTAVTLATPYNDF